MVTPAPARCYETVPPRNEHRTLTILYDVLTSSPANLHPCPVLGFPGMRFPNTPSIFARDFRALLLSAPLPPAVTSPLPSFRVHSEVTLSLRLHSGVCLHSPTHPCLFLLLPWTLILPSHTLPPQASFEIFLLSSYYWCIYCLFPVLSLLILSASCPRIHLHAQRFFSYSSQHLPKLKHRLTRKRPSTKICFTVINGALRMTVQGLWSG